MCRTNDASPSTANAIGRVPIQGFLHQGAGTSPEGANHLKNGSVVLVRFTAARINIEANKGDTMADFDINQARITGGVERFDHIQTKTGTPMIKALVRCYRETISVVAFKDLAENTNLSPGDRVEVRGMIQSTSWTAQDGTKRYGWQLIADHITLLGETQLGETQPGALATGESQPPAPAPPPARPASSARKNESQHRMFDPAAPGPNDYQGGPF